MSHVGYAFFSFCRLNESPPLANPDYCSFFCGCMKHHKSLYVRRRRVGLVRSAFRCASCARLLFFFVVAMCVSSTCMPPAAVLTSRTSRDSTPTTEQEKSRGDSCLRLLRFILLTLPPAAPCPAPEVSLCAYLDKHPMGPRNREKFTAHG